MEKIVFHIDVNSAYLSWSALKCLADGSATDLREIPSIIGGDMQQRHGVVLAKSIPAKKYGITTGEPIVNALRKCPSLVIERPDHNLYHQKSQELMHYLSDICPEIEQLSVDECFMDFTPIRKRFPSPEAAADLIRSQIKERFAFTVNIGISDKKVLAKMASDFQKPDKTHTLYSWEIEKKMWQLPVSSLYMCGSSSTNTLKKLEIRTIGDLAKADKEMIASHLKSHGLLLWEYANGIDGSAVTSTPSEAKGIGNSITLPKDVSRREEAHLTLLSLADSVSARLRKSGQLAGMISVEIKYNDFRSVSHQMILTSPTNTSQLIYETACRLFDELWNSSPIRLLGVRSSKLTDVSEPVQLSLFDLPSGGAFPSSPDAVTIKKSTPVSPSKEKLAALDKTLDSIRQKYGDTAVMRGSFLTDSYEKKL
ncbi:MAG: DNA polymerase IV [Lachnospiraceae bacterium]|nr:DNA polymerase IV [Lachnospiraceae bacterium]